VSRWSRWLAAGPLFAAAAVLAVWGSLHRGSMGGALALAAAPVLVVVGIRMLRRLNV
jgi:hypothetical protein